MHNAPTNVSLAAIITSKWLIHLRGLFLLGMAVLLFGIGRNTSKDNILLFGALAVLAGLCGLAFIAKNKPAQIQKKWLAIESVADMVLGIVAFYFYQRSIALREDFMLLFALFALFFLFMQIFFLLQIAQTSLRVNLFAAIARILMAIGYGIFALALLMGATVESTSLFLLNCVGIGPLIGGLACLLMPLKLYYVEKRGV